MMTDRGVSLKLLIGVACLLSAPVAVQAQTRAETLRQVTGNNINTLDPTTPGATREAFGVSTSAYDRLVAFDRKREAEPGQHGRHQRLPRCDHARRHVADEEHDRYAASNHGR